MQGCALFRAKRAPTAARVGGGLALFIVLLAAPHARARTHGFGPWRFGMSPEQVRATKGCGPYRPVRSTGGLECAGYRFLGSPIEVSFVFRAAALVKVQLWVYEGRDPHKLAQRWAALLHHLAATQGGVESPTHPQLAKLSPTALRALALDLAKRAQPTAKIQFKPRRDAKTHFAFGSAIYNQRHGYYLFLYAQPPR